MVKTPALQEVSSSFDGGGRHDLLKNSYAAGRTNQTKTTAKWHLVHSVAGKSEHQIKCTTARKHESCVLQIGGWIKDQLFGEIVSLIIFSRRRSGIYPPIEGQQENHYGDNQNPPRNRPLPQKIQVQQQTGGFNLTLIQQLSTRSYGW